LTADGDPRMRAGVSVILYVPRPSSHLPEMVGTVRNALGDPGGSEIVIVDDGCGVGDETLRKLRGSGAPVKLIRLSRSFGETAAIDAALQHCHGEVVVTLSARLPLGEEEIRTLLRGVEEGSDLVIGCRAGAPGGVVERFPHKVYRWFTRKLAGTDIRDLSSGARAFRREVVDEIALYGEMIRFLPILASGRGYRVRQIDLEGSWTRGGGRSGPLLYLNRFLDLLTLYFLLRFTRKPLRFFGLFGSALLLPGLLIDLYLFFDRVLLGHGVAGRPLLLLGILLTVLGVQMISIGLIGEMIIFTHSREVRDYSIQEVLE